MKQKKTFQIHFMPTDEIFEAKEGETLLELQIQAGFRPDAPCGGQGTCGKCLADIRDPQGRQAKVLACQYEIHSDLTVEIAEKKEYCILENGLRRDIQLNPMIQDGYGLAIDIGTTSLVCYLLDLQTGERLALASMMNPQSQFGADVISRCEYAIAHGTDHLSGVIRDALNELIRDVCARANIRKEQIQLATIVGNTCMHHLFLRINPQPLAVAPYDAVVKDILVIKASKAGLEISPKAILQVLPNIAGFVGADTVGCMLSTDFDQREELCLLIDIGTNGEMVMGNRDRMIACSTAAGPAFEGAKIECGMRGTKGAIDHTCFENGTFICHVIGEDNADGEDVKAMGICGSGLMDAVAEALDAEVLDETGKINPDHPCVYLMEKNGQPAIRLRDRVYLTQKDIREVQLAKGAVAAGIELLAQELDIRIGDIKRVMIAGAFGNYMDPHSACRIGMIPAELEMKIEMIGNAAGEGAMIATMNQDAFRHTQTIRDKTEFMELASNPGFQDTFVDHLMFE